MARVYGTVTMQDLRQTIANLEREVAALRGENNRLQSVVRARRGRYPREQTRAFEDLLDAETKRALDANGLTLNDEPPLAPMPEHSEAGELREKLRARAQAIVDGYLERTKPKSMRLIGWGLRSYFWRQLVDSPVMMDVINDVVTKVTPQNGR